ncbi:MAG: ABC transporter permease [Candidatus Viridilinea halotolerans]|uniref:ABC transporter permease n=1 Tax=Candidatus Viridilinea halotolerans TaxID=2491704 RepID=A0A426TVN5_9CHLR|nr:MAG: ABC transporter permease [Candidatus Viridilinea halotolerans]
MRWYILSRLLALLPLLFALSLLIFLLLHLIPGSAAAVILADAATPENVAALETQLGLDDPLPVQYGRWIVRVVQGDLGVSLVNGRPVAATLLARLPVTFSLAVGALLVGIVLGLGIGMLAGLRPGSLFDRISLLAASLGMALPVFWLALLLVLWFAVELRWLPAVGYTPLSQSMSGWARSLLLPWLALGLPTSGMLARQMRSALQTALQAPYIQAIRATGVDGWALLLRHALRHALLTMVTLIGFQMTRMIGGAFLVERVFAMPGMGSLATTAVLERDLPLIQGVMLVTACLVVLINLLVDLCYGWLDPRVRL